MASLFRNEGYLLVDHRDSPGLPEDLVHALGLPKGYGKGRFEAPSKTCPHCNVVVILNPKRTRDRAYCASCDSYICDRCGAIMAATGVCKPFDKIIDEAYNAAQSGDALGVAKAIEHLTGPTPKE